MLYFAVDNALYVLLLLGAVVAAFASAWWNTRDRRWLIGSGVGAVLMALVVVLRLLIVTDQMQLESNIDSIRTAFNHGKAEEASRYFDDEVSVDTLRGPVTLPNKTLENLARTNMQHYGVKQIVTGPVTFEDITPPKAVASFLVWADDDHNKMGRCRMEFVQKQGKWRVKTVTVESMIGGQKAPSVLLPFYGK